jgi:uncharacterized membrane protein
MILSSHELSAREDDGDQSRISQKAKGDVMLFSQEPVKKSKRSWLLWLLLLPFISALWPGFYNQVQPTLLGIPFFYWFQILWIIVSAALIGLLALLVP